MLSRWWSLYKKARASACMRCISFDPLCIRSEPRLCASKGMTTRRGERAVGAGGAAELQSKLRERPVWRPFARPSGSAACLFAPADGSGEPIRFGFRTKVGSVPELGEYAKRLTARTVDLGEKDLTAKGNLVDL
jgi:hypothetical protein